MKKKKIIVNLITTLRFILSLLLIYLFSKITPQAFLISVVILYFSDFLDGFFARSWHVETFYGSFLDTIADKTLNITLIVPLIKNIPWFIFILILELGIMFVNIYGKLKGKKVSTKYIGKIKMWFVAISILLGYIHLFWHLNSIFAIISIGITVIFQILTMIDYVLYFKKQKEVTQYFKFKNKKEFMKALFDTEYYLSHN